MFRNAEGYDGHLMINAMFQNGDSLPKESIERIESKFDNYSPECIEMISNFMKNRFSVTGIPKTSEKLLSISNGLIEVRDSYKLTLTSLDKLIFNQVWGKPSYRYNKNATERKCRTESITCKQCNSL